MANWYLQNGKDSDVVISTRVRLARNINGFNFENKCSKNEKRKILAKIQEIQPKVGYGLKLLKLKDMDELTKHALVEKYLISPEFANNNEDDSKAILINDEENICITINGKDHLKIQVFAEGFATDELLNLAVEIDQKLEKFLDYSFNKKYGYLTACPSDVGTGLRVSSTLHLPGLTLTENIGTILKYVNNFGTSVKSVYSEGNKSVGDIYEISNNQTLGFTEQEIAKNVKAVTQKLIEQERTTRKYLGKDKIQFEDEIYRDFGIFTNARIMNSNECMDLLSSVKLGTDMGVISELDDLKVKKLYLYTKTANLQKYFGKTMDSEEENVKRAELIKQIIKE